jgi:hypothetical protein
MGKQNKKRATNVTDNGSESSTYNGSESSTFSGKKKRTGYVSRVSSTGPLFDSARELKNVLEIVETELFPHCKFVNCSKEIDDTGPKSISALIAQKLNIPRDENHSLWWSKFKKKVNSKVNSCRTDANSNLRKKVLGK